MAYKAIYFSITPNISVVFQKLSIRSKYFIR